MKRKLHTKYFRFIVFQFCLFPFYLSCVHDLVWVCFHCTRFCGKHNVLLTEMNYSIAAVPFASARLASSEMTGFMLTRRALNERLLHTHSDVFLYEPTDGLTVSSDSCVFNFHFFVSFCVWLRSYVHTSQWRICLFVCFFIEHEDFRKHHSVSRSLAIVLCFENMNSSVHSNSFLLSFAMTRINNIFN